MNTQHAITQLQQVTTISRRWGTIRTLGPAHGAHLFLLEVYPPGTTTHDRRLAALNRVSPAYGAVLGIAVAVLIEDLHRWALPVLVAAPAALAAFITGRLTRRLRAQIHSLTVTVNFRATGTTIDGNPQLFIDCHEGLRELDADNSPRGRLPAIEYERRWGEIYFRIPPT